jgi:uncharacterized membrane protein HdeD (DUF308 family)
MLSDEQSTMMQTTNRHSIISLVLGILSLLVFCGSALIPIPFTSFFCAPASGLISAAALIYGLVSLSHIKRHNQTGHPMAWTGILAGVFVLLCMLCALAALISLFYFFPSIFDKIPLPPFLSNFQF